jgi:hypothetical protein
MSRKPETTFTNGVHRHLSMAVYHMKNHNDYVGGIPDVWYSGYRNDLWVEYKYLPVSTPRNIVIPDLSLKQLYWIKSRRAEGRNCWVIVGCKPGGVIYTDLWEMEHGIQPQIFLARTLTRKEIAEQIESFCHAIKKQQPRF